MWAFSSGPLDRTAGDGTIGPTRSVAKAMARMGTVNHATFGGVPAKDADGLVAAALAKEHGGDFRNRDHIQTWAKEIAQELAVRP